MAEVQAHGFVFENWVRDQFFAGYEGIYGQKWDVPPDHNVHPMVPEAFRGLPVSIKTAKKGSPIALGDVLRQRETNHDFLMIVGFWEQRTSRKKWFVDIGYVRFYAIGWEALWGRLTRPEIAVNDSIVKDRSRRYQLVRAEAQRWKGSPWVQSSAIVINPKIGSDDQRRIQCSLPNRTFWAVARRDAQRQDATELWNQIFPNPVRSPKRTFKQRR